MKTLKLPDNHPYYNGRVCSSCEEYKRASEYTLSRDERSFGGISMRSKCKSCNEHIKWKSFIKRVYGIDSAQYYKMLEDQEGKCAICKSDSNNTSHQSKNKMFIDHCHTTGQVRGLLCSKCNHALGLFDDDTENLKSAISYLAKFEEKS